MDFIKRLLITSLSCLALTPLSGQADDSDIYAIKFSQDGKYLATGGSGGSKSSYDSAFSGGIKIWNAESGALLKGFGQLAHLNNIFGEDYGRMGIPTLEINNFRDIVINGSYPNGKVIVLPSSLGRFGSDASTTAPSFIGGYFNFSESDVKRIALTHEQPTGKQGDCAAAGGPGDFIGPVVASDNGQYAAVVVNKCRLLSEKKDANGNVESAFDSSLYVMDLTRFEIVESYPRIDSGVYAIGVANNGKRVAYVGAQRFAVLDGKTGSVHTIEKYDNGEFRMPFQFSSLYFSEDSRKLVSLRFIYDIETGTERKLEWKNEVVEKRMGSISTVRVAPDMSYFVLVLQHAPVMTLDEDGETHVQNARHDSVAIMDIESGELKILDVNDPEQASVYCVTDVSPDSKRVAVGCKDGLIRMFDVASGKMLWENRNVGYRNKVGKHLRVADLGAKPFDAAILAMLNPDELSAALPLTVAPYAATF